MDAQLQADLNRVINAIQGISGAINKEAQKELGQAAKPLMQSIKAFAPKGKRVHGRDTLTGKITYKPGNLKRSYRVFKFRRAKVAVHVGVKLGGKIDGYYAQFVNDGTVSAGNGSSQNAQQFVERGVSSAKGGVLRESVNRLSKVVSKYWISTLFGKK